MARSWRAAPSVQAALAEANRRWPRRNRDSDGTIGDARHRAEKSDHNPDARGVVHAFDLTHDPWQGCDCARLAEHLRAARDPRVSYLIWDRRICASYVAGRTLPWEWRPYTGRDPHTHHLHVSIKSTPHAEDDRSPWWGDGPAVQADQEDDMTEEQANQLHATTARCTNIEKWIGGDGGILHQLADMAAKIAAIEAKIKA